MAANAWFDRIISDMRVWVLVLVGWARELGFGRKDAWVALTQLEGISSKSKSTSTSALRGGFVLCWIGSQHTVLLLAF